MGLGAYLKTNRNEPAKQLLTEVIQASSDSATAYQYLGYCFLQINARLTDASKQAADNPDQNPALLESLKADAQSALGEAVKNYSKAIEINDKDWQAYRGLGVAYMLQAINQKTTSFVKWLSNNGASVWI